MTPALTLWLPILVSAVFVFIVSSIIHMVLTYHRNDYKAVDAEDEVMDALRPCNISEGEYFIPYVNDPKQRETDEFKAKLEKGPVAFAGYGLAMMQNSIWYGRGWGNTVKSMFDGFIYALVTAGTIGWLWP